LSSPGPRLLVEHAQDALMLSLAIVLPVLLVAAVVGLIVAAFQAASQIQDPTIAHLPRLLAVVAALVVLGPWMGSQIGAFAERMLLLAAVH
jgi:flagellar biosynthetic protein FliQ